MHPLAAVTLGAAFNGTRPMSQSKRGAYDAVEAYDRLVVGGHSIGGSVGAAGGWVLGGGHSALSPTFGLGW